MSYVFFLYLYLPMLFFKDKQITHTKILKTLFLIIFQAWSNFIGTRFFGGRFSLWTVMPPVTESYAQL